MKLIVTVLLLIVCLSGRGQKASADGWVHVYYVKNSQGFEVAKRIEGDRSWYIDSAAIALERMYLELERVRAKYELAVKILLLLSPEGVPVDRRKYFTAVAAYNNCKL